MHLLFQNKKRGKKTQQLLFPVSFSLSISLQWLRCKNLIFFIFLGVFSVDSILFLSWNALIFVWMLLFWNLTIAGWMPKSELHAQLGAGPQQTESERVTSTQSQSNKLSVFTCFLSLLLFLSSAKTPRLSWKSTSSPSETSWSSAHWKAQSVSCRLCCWGRHAGTQVWKRRVRNPLSPFFPLTG